MASDTGLINLTVPGGGRIILAPVAEITGTVFAPFCELAGNEEEDTLTMVGCWLVDGGWAVRFFTSIILGTASFAIGLSGTVVVLKRK